MLLLRIYRFICSVSVPLDYSVHFCCVHDCFKCGTKLNEKHQSLLLLSLSSTKYKIILIRHNGKQNNMHGQAFSFMNRSVQRVVKTYRHCVKNESECRIYTTILYSYYLNTRQNCLLPSMKSSSVCARFCIKPRQFFVFDVAANVVVVVVVGIVAVLALLQLALDVIRCKSLGLSGCVAVGAVRSSTTFDYDFSNWFVCCTHVIVEACK